ncbi:MAG: hypothetical protein SO067_01595 [Bacilli bacterium]|nr:hypothetical protein [Bacilli bacterium]
MEDERRINIVKVLLKLIVVVLVILFSAWIVTKICSNNNPINSDKLVDQVFQDNLNRMKEVGISYFTLERMPKNVGDKEKITLQDMYDKNLILEVRDEENNLCSDTDSYIEVEKYNDEYQMKVNLSCSNRKDYIIVVMGCYNYCKNEICEKQEQDVITDSDNDSQQNTVIEYEYYKATNGKWTDWSAWSAWQKTYLEPTEYRKVETKVVQEDYTYESTIEEDEYADVIISCPSGYSLNSEGTKCKKISNETTNPVCPTISGYTLYNQDGFTCKYKSNTTVSQVCPSLNGYTIISNQSSGWTCVYKKYLRQGQGLSVPQNTSTRIYEFVTTALIHDCDTCSYYSGVIYNIFARKTQSAVCPSGYTKIGNSCVKTKTNAATCPSGYEKINNTCKKVYYKSIIKSCPTGFTLTNETNQRCYKKVTSVITMHDVRDVTYYRYATREYINGTIDYKWSTSNNDKSLLNNGYKLTGRTRTKKGGK